MAKWAKALWQRLICERHSTLIFSYYMINSAAAVPDKLITVSVFW